MTEQIVNQEELLGLGTENIFMQMIDRMFFNIGL